jgi:hypothetical protein
MAKLKGVFLKTVIGSLMSGNFLFPEYKKVLDGMHDDEWYSWDLYTQMLQDISKKLAPAVVANVGINVILAGKDIFIKEQGFDTIDKLLKGYPDMFNKTIVGLPDHEKIKLIEYNPGHVIMHYTTRQPKAFNEGVIKGFFKLYKKTLKSFKIEQINKDYYEVEISW